MNIEEALNSLVENKVMGIKVLSPERELETEVADYGDTANVYVTNPAFICGIDEEEGDEQTDQGTDQETEEGVKYVQLGVLFKITDMLDATGEEEFEEAPYLVSAEICVDKPHPSFVEYELAEGEAPEKMDLILECSNYMGGVPIDHILDETPLESIKAFSEDEAITKTHKARYGTIAAQRGPVEHTYLQFKTKDAALKYIGMLSKRVGPTMSLIGFILDRPINLVGETGWTTIMQQAKGKGWKRNRPDIVF